MSDPQIPALQRMNKAAQNHEERSETHSEENDGQMQMTNLRNERAPAAQEPHEHEGQDDGQERNFNRRDNKVDADWKSLGKLVRTTPFNHNGSTYLWVETSKACFAVSMPLGKTIWSKVEVTQNRKDLKKVRFGKLELSMFIPKLGGNH